MNDIAPELLNKITIDFNNEIKNNKRVQELLNLLNSGNVTYQEANDYAIEIGKALAKTFKKIIKPDVLPDGRMYFNIGERIIYPTLKKNHDLVSSFTMIAQENMNAIAEIGLKTLHPEFNRQRAKSLIDRLAYETDFSKVQWILQEPIINFTHSVVNDVLQTNAEFQKRTGLSPKIKRVLVGGACDWCVSLAGTYSYPDIPPDVYKRHDKCRCTVEYIPDNIKRQNLWSKSWL